MEAVVPAPVALQRLAKVVGSDGLVGERLSYPNYRLLKITQTR